MATNQVGKSSDSFAASPWAMPAFFAGWMAFGLVIAAILIRRGHDTRSMIAMGAGLGPLMLIVANDTIQHREAATAPVVVSAGVDRGGPIDVLVLIQGDPRDVSTVLPSLSAIGSDLGQLILGRIVDYEWLEGDLDNDAVVAASDALARAAAQLPFGEVEQAILPGTVATARTRFQQQHRHPLVLSAHASPSEP
jgi:hypothetical protein